MQHDTRERWHAQSMVQYSVWIILGAVPLIVLELHKVFSQACAGEDAAAC